MSGISDWVKITGKESTRTEHPLRRGHVPSFGFIKIGESDNSFWFGYGSDWESEKMGEVKKRTAH